MSEASESLIGRLKQRLTNTLPRTWVAAITDVTEDEKALPTELETFTQPELPAIWVLGKTGAGKSTFIAELTQFMDIDIGNGYAPCTQGISEYQFPRDRPLIRFFDTQGLGEAGYDATDDIADLMVKAHMIVVLMKIDDADQSEVLQTLKVALKNQKDMPILVLHTGIEFLSDSECSRVVQSRTQLIAEICKTEVKHLELDFKGARVGLEQMFNALSDVLPLLQLKLLNKHASSIEDQRFALIQNEILWYSSTAAGVALVPFAGATAVVGVQAKMMHSVAEQNGVDWNRQTLMSFASAIGTGFVLQKLTFFGGRTFISALPWVGSALNAVVAFGSTYAFGRVMHYYLYHWSRGEEVTQKELREVYSQAFKEARTARKNNA